MCDYSLQTVRSRPARVGEKLRTRYFNTGTRGLATGKPLDFCPRQRQRPGNADISAVSVDE